METFVLNLVFDLVCDILGIPTYSVVSTSSAGSTLYIYHRNIITNELQYHEISTDDVISFILNKDK